MTTVNRQEAALGRKKENCDLFVLEYPANCGLCAVVAHKTAHDAIHINPHTSEDLRLVGLNMWFGNEASTWGLPNDITALTLSSATIYVEPGTVLFFNGRRQP